jgi:hypothetical protein
MDKNIRINGIDYKGIDTIKVKDAVSEELHSFRNIDDGNIESSDVLLGKVGYGKDGKVIGTYIPSTGEIDGGINFYDQYGAWLTSYSLDDLPLSALPEIPALDGAGADQYEFAWTMTLEEVNALTEEADIGVDVTAKEGAKTYIIPYNDGFSGSTNSIYFYGGEEASSILIDWGDGTANTTLTINANKYATTSHNFATKSYNPITISLTSGGEFYLGGNTTTTNAGSFITSYVNAKEIRIGGGVKGITQTFLYESKCENVLMHNTLEIIGTTQIFTYCYRLKSLNIPKSATTIQSSILAQYCYTLEYIYIHEGVEGSNILSSSCYNLKKLVLPNTYKTLSGQYFVYSTHSLKKFKLPKTPIELTSSSPYILNAVTSIEEIDVSNLVAQNLYSCMYDCSSLKRFEIPEGVTTLKTNCLRNCYFLETVIIPASVETIETSFLYYCFAIKQIIFKGTTPPIVTSGILSGVNNKNNITIYVPTGSLEDYATATNLTTWAERMEEY